MGFSSPTARSYLDSLPAGVTIHVGGRVVYANPALLRMLGVPSPEAALGRSILDFVRPDFHERTLARVRQVYEARQSGDWSEVVFRRDDGGEVPVEVAASSVEWDGEPAAQVLVVDVSRRIQAEQARRETEDRYRRLVEDLPLPVVVHTGDRIVYANAAALRAAGERDPDLVGRDVFSLLHPADADFVRERVHDIYERGHAPTVEVRLVRGDGSVVVAEVRSARVEWEGRPAAQTLVVDVTERRRAEAVSRALEQRVRQAQKNESMEALAGGVAHDFNNLLVGIQGNAELALLDMAPDDPLRPRLEGILSASRRAAELAQQMLSFAGRAHVVVEPLDLSALLRETRGLLSASVPPLATLRFDLAADLPAVSGDRAQLQQVVMHLVANASESLQDAPGTITIATGRHQAALGDLASPYVADDLPPGCYVSLDVIDTGEGMSADVLPRIFDPFFTTRFAGRGLGLAATLGIIRAHHGTVQVTSEPGRGSHFRVLLPSSEQPAWQGQHPWRPAAPPPASGRPVLLVDDDEGVRIIAAHMLRRSGFSVIEAADGRAALSLVGAHGEAVDCVVLDLAMPEMDGRTTMRELRRIRPDLPIVICSGFGEPDIVRLPGGGEQGGLRFVQKPFDRSTLVTAVREALQASA